MQISAKKKAFHVDFNLRVFRIFQNQLTNNSNVRDRSFGTAEPQRTSNEDISTHRSETKSRNTGVGKLSKNDIFGELADPPYFGNFWAHLISETSISTSECRTTTSKVPKESPGTRSNKRTSIWSHTMLRNENFENFPKQSTIFLSSLQTTVVDDRSSHKNFYCRIFRAGSKM